MYIFMCYEKMTVFTYLSIWLCYVLEAWHRKTLFCNFLSNPSLPTKKSY